VSARIAIGERTRPRVLFSAAGRKPSMLQTLNVVEITNSEFTRLGSRSASGVRSPELRMRLFLSVSSVVQT